MTSEEYKIAEDLMGSTALEIGKYFNEWKELMDKQYNSLIEKCSEEETKELIKLSEKFGVYLWWLTIPAIDNKLAVLRIAYIPKLVEVYTKINNTTEYLLNKYNLEP